MCGRFTLTRDIVQVSHFFGVAPPDAEVEPRYNAAPFQTLPVISSEDASKVLFYRWGLLPFWAKDEKIANKLINARSETLRSKPAFRRLIDTQRCLILADGFYEWQKTSHGKQPYRFVLKNGESFGLAGIWDMWKDDKGRKLKTFTIITTDPNDVVMPVHDRMPVILTRDQKQAWLSENLHPSEVDRFLKPFPSSKLRGYAVSKAVNYAQNEGEELIVPARAQAALFEKERV